MNVYVAMNRSTREQSGEKQKNNDGSSCYRERGRRQKAGYGWIVLLLKACDMARHRAFLYAFNKRTMQQGSRNEFTCTTYKCQIKVALHKNTFGNAQLRVFR